MKNMNTRTLTRVALLVAIELVMKAVGLGSVPMGPLYMSFLTLPIAVGAITMGPAVGAILGGVFGAVSFYDAITGASAMTGALMRAESYALFLDFAQPRQRKYLKSTGIRQDRFVPGHKFMKAAHLLDDLVSRSYV